MLPGWLRRIAGFVVGTVVGHYVWPVSKSLGEAAAAEWVNHQIAEKIGLVGPTQTQVINFIVSWGGPALAVLLAYGLFRGGAWWERKRASSKQPQEPRPIKQPGKESPLLPIASPAAMNGSKRLKISFGEDGLFVSTRSDGLWKQKKTLSCEVRNDDPSAHISNCKIEITHIEPEFGPGSWILRDDFTLSGGERIYMPLARYSEADSISNYHDNVIEICMPADTQINKMPLLQTKLKNVLTIRATGINTAFYEAKCILWIDEAGRLRIKDQAAVKTPADNANASPRPSSARRKEVPLWEASRRTYDALRNTRSGEMARSINDSTDGIIQYYAYTIADKIPLYGTPALSTAKERITLNLNSSEVRIEFHNLTARTISMFGGGTEDHENLFVYEDDLDTMIHEIREANEI